MCLYDRLLWPLRASFETFSRFAFLLKSRSSSGVLRSVKCLGSDPSTRNFRVIDLASNLPNRPPWPAKTAGPEARLQRARR